MTGRQEDNIRYLELIENAVQYESQYVKGFVNYLSSMAIKSRYSYITKVIKFLKEINKKETDLKYIDFLFYISNIQYTENGEETTPSYRITVYAALKKFSKFLFISKVIPENYMENIEKPKSGELQKTIAKRENAYLTESELQEYVYNVNNGITTNNHTPQGRWRNRDKAIISIFLTTGIRCSALMKLDISDIDIEKRTLLVTDKGDKVSSYYMSDDTISIVEKWMDDRSKMFIDGSALFVTKYRKRMTENSISDVTKKYAFTIKGKNISPHKLRATYGTMLYNKTKDLYFVQKCMKHSSPKTTEIYIRGEGKENAEASEIMSKLL